MTQAYLLYYKSNKIVKCKHKLHALFKQTYNLRDLLNFKIKVYVEGEGETKDSDFYEAVYVILSSYSDKYLRNNQNEKDKFF